MKTILSIALTVFLMVSCNSERNKEPNTLTKKEKQEGWEFFIT